MQAPGARKMMSLSDARDLVTSLFIMLNKNIFILFRIEFLVVLVTVLFFVMFLMDYFRRIIHNSTMRAIFRGFDAVSDSIVLYLLGAMQSAPFKNELFPVWALVLVNFRYSADYISGYGLPDRDGRRFIEWRNVLKLLGSAFLNWSRGSRFAYPLWSLWALQILRSGYRFYSHDLASHSVWHGESSELVSEYMHVNYGTNNKKSEDYDSKKMDGYKYLVYGESKQGIKFQKPEYAMYIDSATHQQRKNQSDASREEQSPLVTLDKIWKYLTCPTHPENNLGKDGKDLSLAFALSRLLRCRLEDVTLQGKIFDINRRLVEKLIDNKVGTHDAFRIMELQLGLTDDYFNTRYPMVFCCGFLSFFLNLVPSMVTFGVVCWLGVDIRRVYNPPTGELANLVQGGNVDMIITWAFIVLMMVKEIWEIVTYLFSDWMRLLLVCKYVQLRDKGISHGCVDYIILRFFRSKITSKRWHGHIDQYVFVQSYDDRPRCWNYIHNLTTGMVPKKEDGAKLSSAIEVPQCVRKEVLEKLCKILKEFSDDSLPKDYLKKSLPKDIKTLSDVNDNRREQLQQYLAYFDLPTSSHIILVWHIATSLCEMELAEKHGVDLSSPGCLGSLLSGFSACCSSKPYLMDVDEKKKKKVFSWFTNCCSSKSNEKKKENWKLHDKLQERYITANSLSRYCAYLLVSKPDLIPDRFLVPKIVFQNTVKSARDGILKYCDSLQRRHEKLKEEAEKPIRDDKEDVLKQGAMLGKKLLDLPNEEVRWEILAGVWAELLIHIAPTWNAEAHKKCLSGGEFITHIWALLWHCGIQESSLWPKEDAPENNAPEAPQDNNVGNDNKQAVDKTWEAGADMRNNQMGIKVHEADEVAGTKEHGAGNLSRGPRRTQETGSSEIGEASQDETVEATNVQRGMAGKA